MEIHPILEAGDCPSDGLWYVVSPEKPPEARVGLACVARSEENCGVDEVLSIGGANPSATFSDVFKLNWKTFQWSKLECSGFRSRYEHAAYIPESFPNLIYVYGGANKSGNLDCLQSFDTATSKWSVVTYEGQCPGPRTLHCAGFFGDKMYVFGGGDLGTDPVADVKLHIFDAKVKSWTQQAIKADAPSARHGHAMAVVGLSLYIHGGMAGSLFYDDLRAINLEDFSSQKLVPVGDVPCARAGHSACTFETNIYLFGGMCMQGALDDFYTFSTATLTWMALKFDCPPPAPRLDHSMLCTLLPVKKGQSAATESQTSEAPLASASFTLNGGSEKEDSHSPKIVAVDIWQGTVAGDVSEVQNLSLKDSGDRTISPEPEVEASSAAVIGKVEGEHDYVPVCVVIGGMDTSGNLYNDILITKIHDQA